MKAKGYQVFENDSRNYNLNIVGVRSRNIRADKFDDNLIVFWKYQGKWNLRMYPITTDPGAYSLMNVARPEGCAILKEGQYKGCWQLGVHRKGKRTEHKALVQVRPVTVYRDNTKDLNLDRDNGSTMTGKFGINIHRSSVNNRTNTVRLENAKVGKWSAGCQVFCYIDQFEEFLDLCQKSSIIYGNSFSYTLLNEADLQF